jgi:hypothetical protein
MEAGIIVNTCCSNASISNHYELMAKYIILKYNGVRKEISNICVELRNMRKIMSQLMT